MKIEKISLTPRSIVLSDAKNNKQPLNGEPRLEAFNPPAYRDFNINFSARLFRTPSNFYAQPFNRNGMPDTMKNYLFEDYEDRKNMPPAQMLKLVFSDINEAKTLEHVKRLYPEEPLFAKLIDVPNKKFKSGVLAEIELMKEESGPLFKDGSDHLGMYLLRKVYQEGKTLKEINTDFEKDISKNYNGLSPIQYETLAAYGIKYPNHSFWTSLTATREEFPYEYKPRKAIVSRVQEERVPENAAESKPAQTRQNSLQSKKKFDNVKDWEIDKLAKAFVKGKGSRKATQKELKNTNIRDEESLNFVAKYFSEINSIVMRRLHVSDEMKGYFENYDNLTASQREKFETYWKNPELNSLQSMVMKETIRLFFNTYGADGDNDDFKELLEYAHNIKSKRLERQQKHDLLQQEYEQALGIFEPETAAQEKAALGLEVIDDADDDGDSAKYQKIFEDLKKEYNVDSYEFDTEQGKVAIVSNLKEALKEHLDFNTRMMPKAFAAHFISFVMNNPEISDSYILTTLLAEKGIKLPADDRLMDIEDADDITLSLYQKYSDKYPIANRAAKQAVTDAFIAMTGNDITPALLRLGVFEFSDLFKSMGKESQNCIFKQSRLINEKYNEYKRPLSDYEIYRVLTVISNLIRKYNPDKSIIKNDSPFKGMNNVIAKMRDTLTESKYHKELFNKEMTKYLAKYGGSARFFLDKNMPDTYKMAKLEEFICTYCYDEGSDSSPLGI